MGTRTPLQVLSPAVPFVLQTEDKLTLQLVRHFDRMLATDQVRPGGRLLSERRVASDLKVSRNTVTAAYNELEQRGLIRRIRGKGAFRCNPQITGEGFSWSGKVSSKAHLLDEPVLELLARNSSSGISHPFSAGTPSLECFPTAEYHEAVNRVILDDFPNTLAVAPTEGQGRLRRSIARWLNVEPNRVMVTSGGQEAIDLLARCLIEPGDYAIVESPTYPGAIQCLRAAGARLIGWDAGWDLDQLEELLLRYRPKLLFTMPTFQNPTGKVMPLATRKGLLDLATRYHLPILEDDVYSKTYLNDRVPPDSLLKLDGGSRVIYISTFSKMLAPGLRVGWVVAPLYMVKQLSLMKMRANLFTEGLNQIVLSNLMESGEFDQHLRRLRSRHGELLNTALTSLKVAGSNTLMSCPTPSGGLYLWCKLPPETDLDLFYASIEAQGVALAPGHAFFPGSAPEPYFRLCFTASNEADLSSGIAIVAQTLQTLQAAGTETIEG